jgi:two-component system, OmpR family, sensor histidine kinase KdpD
MGLLVCEQPSAGARLGMDGQTLAILCEIGAIALERAYLMEEMTKAQVLAETERLRTALLSSISHDFRTPLSSILASATALIEHGQSFTAQTTSELLAEIRDQAGRINRYVANLLDMIKLESGSIAVKLEPTDVIEIIAAASRRCGGATGSQAQGWLRRTFPSDLCLVEADPVLLEQAVFNVLENAILYSPPDSRVEIALHASLHVAKIVITDEGPGIPPEDLERVFDKFYCVGVNRVPTQGTGLGLPICRGLVEAMGGTVTAKSPASNGHGTSVHICLRRVAEV